MISRMKSKRKGQKRYRTKKNYSKANFNQT